MYFYYFYRPHSEGMGKAMFSQAPVRPHLPRAGGGGGSGSGLPHPFPGQDGGYSHPRSRWREGGPRVPFNQQDGIPPPPSWSGPGGTPFPGQDRGVPRSTFPHQQDGSPPPPVQVPGKEGRGVPPTETAWRVLATRRAECLLRSRRRTFLLVLLWTGEAYVLHLVT